MRTKTTVWARRVAVAVATVASVVLLSAAASSAAPAHHTHTTADGTWSSPAVSFFKLDGTWS